MSEIHEAKAQRLLAQLGFYTDSIDGDFGQKSLNALNKLIKESGIELPTPKQPNTDLNMPAWIEEGRSHIGLREIKGPVHEQTILDWAKELGGGSFITTDEIPWCGTFAAICLKRGGRAYPKHWYRALAYLENGTKLDRPAYGAIGVMKRNGGGHVCQIVGITHDGKFLIGQGGNQSDKVCLMKFPISRFEALMWPPKSDGTLTMPHAERYDLPKYSNSMQLSVKEN